LGEGERCLRRETEAGVGLALQAREIEEERRGLGGGLGLLRDRSRPALAGGDDFLRPGPVPEALGARLRILALAEARIEPASRVGPGGHAELGVNLVVGPRDEALDLLLALDDDRQRGRLDPAHGREVEATVAR